MKGVGHRIVGELQLDVVEIAFFGIAESGIGLRDQLEGFASFDLSGLLIRMVAFGEGIVGFPYGSDRGGGWDPQDLIMIHILRQRDSLFK